MVDKSILDRLSVMYQLEERFGVKGREGHLS